MKRICMLVILVGLSLSASARTLHVLIYSAVNDVTIGESCRVGLKAASDFYADIAKQIGYTLSLDKNTNLQFTRAEVGRDIASLIIGKDDILVFYYDGHGYNEGKDKWPTLSLDGGSLWLTDVLKLLNNYKDKAKLILCLADCCNVVYSRDISIVQRFNPVSPSNIRALFTDFEGQKTVLASSSIQGQKSYSIQNGGLFSLAFFASVHELTDNSKPSPTWKDVETLATQKTIESARALKRKQTPQFQIITSSNFNPYEHQ